jgi:hypothetical protein
VNSFTALTRRFEPGAFQIDYDDGKVRYELASIFPNQTLTAGLMWSMIQCATFAVDNYVPALMKVAFSQISPSHALEQAEAECQAEFRRLGGD